MRAKFPYHSQYPGIAPFTSAARYATRDGDSYWNNKDAFTCIAFGQSEVKTGGASIGWMNLLGTTTSDISGFSLFSAGNVIYAVVGNGSDSTVVTLSSDCLTSTQNGTQDNGQVYAVALRWDASTEAIKLDAFTSGSGGSGGTHATATGTLDVDDWGTIGTASPAIRVGHYYAVSTGSILYSGSHLTPITNVSLWFNSITDVYLPLMVGQLSGVNYAVQDTSRYYDVSGAGGRPDHEWIPVLGNESTIPDTGKGTTKDLTIYNGGSAPAIRTHRSLTNL